MQIAMIQDTVVPMSELTAPYLDRGLFFGDGVYEVIRSYNGRIFALDEHMERFASSLKGIRITGVDIQEIRARVLRAFSAAEIENAKIYFHITRGAGPRSHVPLVGTSPSFLLTVTELEDDPTEKERGIAVSTHPDLRWKRCDIKSLNLLPNVLARQDAAEKGCAEAILVNEKGLITEGAASAFFAIRGDRLQTTPLTTDILPSITRKYVIKAADNLGLETDERSLTPEQANKSDELFIAVTTKDILPVVKFDGQPIGEGKPGKQTRALIIEYRAFTG